MRYIKTFVDFLVAMTVALSLITLKVVGIERSSRFFSWLMVKIGPRLKHNKTLLSNLKMCLGVTNESELVRLQNEIWSNLGMIIGESIHWYTMSFEEFRNRVQVVGKKKSYTTSKMIFVSAHLSNFEMFYKVSEIEELPAHLIARPINNKFLDFMLSSLRENSKVKIYSKSFLSLKFLLQALMEDKVVGLLADQKLREGVPMKFFGLPAQTTNLPAKLALKTGAVIVLVRIRRVALAKYRVEFYEPFTDGLPQDPDTITQHINDEIESWIREQPGEWFWMHNRWKNFS